MQLHGAENHHDQSLTVKVSSRQVTPVRHKSSMSHCKWWSPPVEPDRCNYHNTGTYFGPGRVSVHFQFGPCCIKKKIKISPFEQFWIGLDCRDYLGLLSNPGLMNIYIRQLCRILFILPFFSNSCACLWFLYIVHFKEARVGNETSCAGSLLVCLCASSKCLCLYAWPWFEEL